jgi:hypothetical protein
MKETKKYIVSELWGSLYAEDREIEAKNIAEAKKKYLEMKDGSDSKKIVYDSIKDHVTGSSHVICLQEGFYEKSTRTTYIRGKRYFYRVVDK